MNINGINSTNRIMNSYGKSKVNNSVKKENIQLRDKLEISNAAKSIQNKSLDIKVDHSKDIERIKEAIKNGTYKVNSEDLAKAMVERMRGNNI